MGSQYAERPADAVMTVGYPAERLRMASSESGQSSRLLSTSPPPSASPRRQAWYERQASIHEQAFDALPDPVVFTQPNGNVTSVNAIGKKLLGVMPGSAQHAFLERFYTGAKVPAYRQIQSYLFEAGCIKGSRYLVRSLTGELMAVSLSVSPLHIEDMPVRHFFHCRDLTREETDPLTGCYNRRRLDETLLSGGIEIVSECVGVLFIDLDDFGVVNTDLGQTVGDAIICQMADILKKSVRQDDDVIRHGGDEFVFIVQCANRANVSVIANKLLRTIRSTKFPIPGTDETRSFTASIGVAVAHRSESNFASVFERAERAKRRAKHAGKDRVAIL